MFPRDIVRLRNMSISTLHKGDDDDDDDDDNNNNNYELMNNNNNNNNNASFWELRNVNGIIIIIITMN